MIPYGRQEITETDIAAVVAQLQSDFLTQGSTVPHFEERVAAYCGVPHAVAVNSATSALHLACLSLGLGAGDWLWTSPISFVASANCARYCGAQVDFVDIDPRTYNLSVAALERKLQAAEQQGRLPKIVVPVHLAGQSCDMAALQRLAQRYGFYLIEDASHAIGGRYQNEPIGNCRYSDMTVFSFHPVKIITTGEGGMILTRNPEWANRLARLRSHGITRDPAEMTHESEGGWYYQQLELGFNYRLTDIQAALGLSQMDRLDSYVARRHQLADRYDQQLADLPLTLPYRDPASYSAFHLYIIRLQRDRARLTHLQLFNALREAGVGVNLHYIPIHLQPYYQQMGFQAGDFPEAERYYQEAVSLPLYPLLTEADQNNVIQLLQRLLSV